MKKLIHKHLSKYFFIKEDQILLVGGKLRGGQLLDNPVSSSHIVHELKIIFGITRKEAKSFLKFWIYKQDRKFPFKTYWNAWVIDFPSAMRVTPRMFTYDVVAVQPMEMPSSILYYLDHDRRLPIMGVDPVNPAENNNIAIGMHTMNATTTGMAYSHGANIDVSVRNWGYIDKALEKNQKSLTSKCIEYYKGKNLLS